MNETINIRAIRRLEQKARALEPDAAERQRLFEDVAAYAEEFLQAIDELPAFVDTDDKGVGLYDSPIQDEPRPMPKLLQHLKHDVDRPGLNTASGRHLGYIPGGGIYASALGDYLAAVTNRFAGVFFPGPGAVRMENMLLEWMRELVGYPKGSTAGNLTSGGSIANLMGIVAARDAFGLKGRDFERSVVYLSEQAHHSLGKALRIAGLGECIERFVPLDERHRMQPESLAKMIREDRATGRLPFLIIASAGTTDTGVVDPIERLADICEREELWFHVDAAYGGFFLLCDEGKKILRGLDRSHSLIMDPHKTLFIPYGSGAVLVRDRSSLLESHHYLPNYLQDTRRAQDELSPADVSPELSKHFRGLRLWMPLLLHGVAPFRAALEEKRLLARYFHQQLRAKPRFEVGPYPDLSVVIFRYVPQHGDPNEFNRKLVHAIHQDGTVFLSSTMVNGQFTLRMAVSAFRTHLETIQRALDIIETAAKRLESI